MEHTKLKNSWKSPLIVASILNNLKSLMKKIYKKGCTEKFIMKNDPSIYFISSFILIATWLSYGHVWATAEGMLIGKLMLTTAYRYLFNSEVIGSFVMRLGS